MKNTLLCILFVLGVTANVYSQCAAPVNLQASYANNVTSFTWNAVNGATGYVLEAKQSSYPWAYPEVIDTVTTNSHSLTGIMHSLSFDWRVKAICLNGVSSYTTASYVVPCPVPSGLNAGNVTMTGATLNWTPAAGYNTYVSDFVVAYRAQGSITWISLGHTSASSKTVSNLQANTTYEWCVNQTCPYFNSAPVISTFTTAGCNSAGNNTRDWISLFKLGSISRTSNAENGGYVQTNMNTSLAAGSSRNSAQIRAGNSGAFNNKQFKIYIDYNDNSIYEETEVAYGPAAANNTKTIKFKVAIPNNARSGTHGMRVIMARNGVSITGCMSGFYGETEDYSVTITGGSNKALAITNEIAEDKKLIVYPNPVADNLNIDMTEGVVVIAVYDMMGKQVFQQQTKENKLQVNVAGWPATQYVLIATYEDGHKEQARFVKY